MLRQQISKIQNSIYNTKQQKKRKEKTTTKKAISNKTRTNADDIFYFHINILYGLQNFSDIDVCTYCVGIYFFLLLFAYHYTLSLHFVRIHMISQCVRVCVYVSVSKRMNIYLPIFEYIDDRLRAKMEKKKRKFIDSKNQSKRFFGLFHTICFVSFLFGCNNSSNNEYHTLKSRLSFGFDNNSPSLPHTSFSYFVWIRILIKYRRQNNFVSNLEHIQVLCILFFLFHLERIWVTTFGQGEQQRLK